MLLTELQKQRLIKASFEMRNDILDLCFLCGTQNGHLGGCMSAVEILAILYLEIMNISNTEIQQKYWDKRDRFVLSKGHAGMALYAALKQANILSEYQLKQGIRGENTILYRHPKYNPEFGIECSVGSLGMGIGFAVGLAETAKREKNDCKIYTMVGDGECDEGAVWESIAYASHRQLDNFVLIVDENGLQLDGKTKDVLNLHDLCERIKSFGFVAVMADGHDFQSLYDAFQAEHKNKPLAIIAKTVKGKGVSFAENKVEWHDNFLSAELYQRAKIELKEQYLSEFEVPSVTKDKICIQGCHFINKNINTKSFDNNVIFTEKVINELTSLGCKNVVGYVSNIIANYDPKFSLVYSDCANRIGIRDLYLNHPEMCYETGIAEQNQLMISAAMALEGYDVFAVAYAPFITARVLDQIRSNLGYMKSPVKLIGLTAGFAASDLGATHTALEDIGNLRGIPNMTVICPADCTEIAKTMLAVANWRKPVYIRITSGINPGHKIYDSDYKFTVGKAVILREGYDVAIIGCGAVLIEILKSADELEEKGVSCKVVNMHTIKPLDTETIKRLLNVKLLITVEEHSIIGGLGSAVAEFLSKYSYHAPLLTIGVNDKYYIADLPVNEMKRAGLVSEKITKRIMNKLEELDSGR